MEVTLRSGVESLYTSGKYGDPMLRVCSMACRTRRRAKEVSEKAPKLKPRIGPEVDTFRILLKQSQKKRMRREHRTGTSKRRPSDMQAPYHRRLAGLFLQASTER